MDLNKMLRKNTQKDIINKNIIYHPDRNIDNVILNCYANLNSTKLAAYSMEYADTSTEFYCVFKAQIDKIYSKYKNKLSDPNKSKIESIGEILDKQKSEESIDVRGLFNDYKILKLKYVVDPVRMNNPHEAINAIDKTLQIYHKTIESYSNSIDTTYDYLISMRNRFEKEIKEQHIPKKAIDLDNDTDLFIQEQLVLLPIYEGDSKYTINGIKYYGIFNNCGKVGILTSKGFYGVKVFKDGNIFVTYLHEKDDVFYIKFFGNDHNIIYALTDKSSDEIQSYTDVFDPTDDPLLRRKYEATLAHWRMMEEDENNPLLKEYVVKSVKPDITRDRSVIPNVSNTYYVKRIREGIVERYKLTIAPEDTHIKQYEFLGTLEEEIYRELNGTTRMKKNLSLSAAKLRINLFPTSILKTISGSSREESPVKLFVSTSTEPNPFDIFYLFEYMKTTQHTVTGEAKTKKGVALTDNEKLIKYDDTDTLGEFSPKSENNIGRSSTLKFSIEDKYITRRKTIS